MPATKFIKCSKCGKVFEYKGVGRVPDLCPDCKPHSGPIDTGRTVTYNGVKYRVLQYPKTKKEVLEKIEG
jgi:Zn finger protein HypA/HybF involved in hydrogenase expression